MSQHLVQHQTGKPINTFATEKINFPYLQSTNR